MLDRTFGRLSDWTPLSRPQSPSPFLLRFATGWAALAEKLLSWPAGARRTARRRLRTCCRGCSRKRHCTWRSSSSCPTWRRVSLGFSGLRDFRFYRFPCSAVTRGSTVLPETPSIPTHKQPRMLSKTVCVPRWLQYMSGVAVHCKIARYCPSAALGGHQTCTSTWSHEHLQRCASMQACGGRRRRNTCARATEAQSMSQQRRLAFQRMPRNIPQHALVPTQACGGRRRPSTCVRAGWVRHSRSWPPPATRPASRQPRRHCWRVSQPRWPRRSRVSCEKICCCCGTPAAPQAHVAVPRFLHKR